MKMKKFFLAACLAVGVMGISACSDTVSDKRLAGSWVEPVPGMEDEVQGVRLEKGGKAASINMATLKYENWKREGRKLILEGESIGNRRTIRFSDTMVVVELDRDNLILERTDGFKVHYKKAE